MKPVLNRKGGLEVQLFDSKATLGKAAADFVAECLRRAISERGEANLLLATGASQYEFLEELCKIRDVGWARTTAFHLDEYCGMQADHPASFRRYLHERVFQHLPFHQVHLLQGDAPDPHKEVQRYAGLLAGRVIDIACIGIGENAHLAFNDPPADFDTQELLHIVDLDVACRHQQVGEGHFDRVEDVPKQALSLTIPAILSARTISCAVPDRRKAKAVRCALEGPLSPDCPASILRRHNDSHLFLDPESASLLSQDFFARGLE